METVIEERDNIFQEVHNIKVRKDSDMTKRFWIFIYFILQRLRPNDCDQVMCYKVIDNYT